MPRVAIATRNRGARYARARQEGSVPFSRMRAPAIVLVLLGATAQLAGLLLVALEIRASRALVRVHRAEADTIAKANASIYAGLGAASVFSQWAMREHLALRLLLADALRSESRRAAYGALLLGVGIALSAAGSMVGLA